MADTILLLPNYYLNILNKDNGQIRTEVGPKRLVLSSNEVSLGTSQQAIILQQGQYCVINNPYDPET
jgi:hypothetical protein